MVDDPGPSSVIVMQAEVIGLLSNILHSWLSARWSDKIPYVLVGILVGSGLNL
jgi:hypothetical protein